MFFGVSVDSERRVVAKWVGTDEYQVTLDVHFIL